MIRSMTPYAFLPAIAAICLLGCLEKSRAEEISVIDSINGDDPGWKYLYTIDNGLAVDPTADAQFGFAVTGPGGAAIWAFDVFDTSAPVVGFVYDTIGMANDVAILDWQDGVAPFHYGGVDGITGGGTLLDQPPSGQRRAQYFRKEINVPVALDHVMLDGIIDDVGVFYIDGVEVFRGGNGYNSPALLSDPSEVPRFDDGAGTDVGGEVFRTYGSLLPEDPVNGYVLSAGPHVFAVEMHQGGGNNGTGSSDMGMSIRLYGNAVPEPSSIGMLAISLLGLLGRRRRN